MSDKKEEIIAFIKANPNISAENFTVYKGAPCSRGTAEKIFNLTWSKIKENITNQPNGGSTVIERLLGYRTIDNAGCWNWTKSVTEAGYGRIRYNEKRWLVHRLSFSLFVRSIKENEIIRHKCDNRKCFNPEHLEAGSYSDNMIDLYSRKIVNKAKKLAKMPPTNQTIYERVQWYVDNGLSINECIKSHLKEQHTGYSRINYKGKEYRLSRLICSLNYDLEYEDQSWLNEHTCDNKFCINPDHQIPGTKVSNAKNYIKRHK